MTQHRPVVDHFHKRLLAAVNRSSLLKATVSRTGRLLDAFRLESVEPGLSRRVLQSVVDGQPAVPLKLQLRCSHSEPPPNQSDERRTESPEERRVREHRAIYDSLDRRMRRTADLIKRETGVHSLWLGYPLLYLVNDADQWILAPVFLWPISVQPDLRQEGRVLIGRDAEAGPAKFNRAMAGWVSRQLNLQLNAPDEDQLDTLSWSDLPANLQALAGQFRDPPNIQCDAALEPVPNAKLLNPQHSPRLFNSAVLGVYRWQNEAILADMEHLQGLQSIDGVAAGFVSGQPLSRPDQLPRPPEADRFQVFDADFSQERVIWQARTEPGVVVHGPPGTGKSQTIVNIIADALAHGRTVLMVCQKYAATRVVYEKLKQVGLDSLCLEVTDSNRGRLPVFRAIRNQVESLPRALAPKLPAQREQLAREISSLEDELDDYARALHQRQDRIGLAYHQLKTMEGTTYAEFPTVRPLPSIQSIAAGLSASQLETLRGDIEQAGRLFAMGKPLTNPWRYRQPQLQVTASLTSDVAVVVERLRALDSQHSAQVAAAGRGIEISGQLDQFGEIVSKVIDVLRPVADQPASVNAQLLRGWVTLLREIPAESWSAKQAQCESAVVLAQQVLAQPLDATWHVRLQSLTGTKLRTLFRHARTALAAEARWWRFLSLGFRRARKAIREFDHTATDDVVWDLARQIVDYEEARELRQRLASLNQSLLPHLNPANDQAAQTRYPAAALQAFQSAQWLCRQQTVLAAFNEFFDAWTRDAQPNVVSEFIAKLEQSVARLPLAQATIEAFGAFNPLLSADGLAHPTKLVCFGDSISPWLDDVMVGVGQISSLIAWDLSRNQMAAPLGELVAALEEYERLLSQGEQVPARPQNLLDNNYGRWWIALVDYSASLAWQGECHRAHPILVTVTPGLHAQKVTKLQRWLTQKRDLEAETILAKWFQRQVELAPRSGDWKRMFQMRRGRRGDAKRLREAIALSLSEGLLTMRPCWLVNPATAAEIFPLEPGLFDLVIFDEASQCPVEHALPAIFRGKSVVVSGDEKQLPPTDFFQSSWDDQWDDNDMEQEATDQLVSRDQKLKRLSTEYLLQVEDLLGAAIGNLPERYLCVHYRSRHPALIEFSNRAFYNGRLEAPPAPVSSVNGNRPIRYYDVQGTYQSKVRTNPDEARQVVEILKTFWSSNQPCPTIGVVTFNRPQCELIEDLLEETCHNDRAFEVRYRQEVAREEDDQDVGFFVKNLENVQGDEREVMIFSTTFGRDGDGRFYRRFGPVGAVGGERRLNVAVTRAKRQVIIVGSMPIEEISTALAAGFAPGSQLTPAGYLQLYLAYAQGVSEGDRQRMDQVLDRAGQASTVMTTGDSESPFEDDVRQVLENAGLTVHGQIGDSGFRIDLGVVARDPVNGYILGIECDGASYHSDRTARLRDVWRAQILRGRGWRLHRIWSTRWWYHRGEEIASLQLAVDQAQAQIDKQLSATSIPSPGSAESGAPQAWQLTFAEWQRLRDELTQRGDQEKLAAIGGLGTNFEHRYRVEQALKRGDEVPAQVLADYPELQQNDDDEQE